MRVLLAYFFRFLFRFDFFKPKFFGIYQRIFEPFKLFKNTKQIVDFDGIKLKLYLDDWIHANIFFLRTYESAELKAMTHFLKSDSNVIDIGGNIGLFSLFSAKTIQKEGKIISFEPFSINFERFQENIALNSFSTIALEKQAVGDSVGSIRLYYDFSEGNLGMVSTKKIDNATSEEVPVNTIDNYLKTKPLTNIDFVKIDVEGHELSVLNGMVDTIKQYQPAILLEVLDNDENAMKVLDFMQKMQYQKSYINDDGTLSAVETNSKRKNYIFTYNNELK